MLYLYHRIFSFNLLLQFKKSLKKKWQLKTQCQAKEDKNETALFAHRLLHFHLAENRSKTLFCQTP